MEFNFNCAQLFKCEKEGIGIISGDNIPRNSQNIVSQVLDSIGEASAKVKLIQKIIKAQGLKSVITTGLKFIGSDHKIYINCEGKKAIGFIKIGKKNLFIIEKRLLSYLPIKFLIFKNIVLISLVRTK